MSKSLFRLFMPYCGYTKDDLLCLCNRDYKVVFSCRLEKPLTRMEVLWISDGLLLDDKDGVFRFYLYKGDLKSKSHPENCGNDKIDGKEDPSLTVRYYIRISRLTDIVGSVTELEPECAKSDIDLLLSPYGYR